MTAKPIPRRVLQAIFAAPWAISAEWMTTAEEWSNVTAQEWIETIVAIARREPKETIEAVEAKAGRPLSNTHSVSIRDNGVAVIPVEGVIFRYADSFGMISGGVSVETLMKDITAAIEESAIKAVILNFDSPGGQIKGINELANHIDALSKIKPVVSYGGGIIASAAYYLAAAANEIVIDPTVRVGSLGIIAQVDTSRSSADGKVLTIVSSQSPNKVLDPTTEAGRSALQAEVDALAQHMLETIGGFRGMSVDSLIAAGGAGGTQLGKKAVAAGLADRLGSLESLVSELGRPRVAAARTNSTRRIAMAKNNPASEVEESATAETPEMIALRKENETLRSKAATAEATAKTALNDKAKAEANAKVDTLEREGRLSGNATTAFRKVYVAVACGETVAIADLDTMAAALPKLDTTRVALNANKDAAPNAVAGGIALEDFAKAGTDVATAKKIAAVVSARKKSDPKFTAVTLERELRTAARR